MVGISNADSVWVERARKGDSYAIDLLWQGHHPKVMRFFIQRVANRCEAEDLASETMFAAFQALPSFRGMGGAPGMDMRACSFGTFVIAIANHKLSRWVRRKKSRPEVAMEDLPCMADPGEEERSAGGVSNDPLDELLAVEQMDEVCAALASVPSSAQFKVLLLHHMAGLDQQMTSSLLKIRPEAVNNRLQDGRATFRRKYAQVRDAEEWL